MNTTLAEIVSKIASQGKNPDVSFLKDNPAAQTMLLMALLSNSQAQQAVNKKVTSNNSSPQGPQVDTSDNSIKSGSTSDTSSASPTKTAEVPSRKPGRKPVIHEENTDNPKLKRKAQNRAAQRAFRERKENHVRILEDRVKELEELASGKNAKLFMENEKLKEMVAQLQKENASLLGSSFGFDLPLSKHENDERPQKIIRSSFAAAAAAATMASPLAPNSDSHSYSSDVSISSKSRSNTPESQMGQKPVTIDDILGLDNNVLPSNALFDHSELLNLNSQDPKFDYSTQLDTILNQHHLNFATDPSQFDFFYPIQQTNHDILDTASLTVPPAKEDPEIKSLTKAWDKLSEHPRFDEIDMDLLCDEMHKKATCTEDNNTELENLVNELYPMRDESQT